MPEEDYKSQKKELDAKLREIEREIEKRKKTLEYLIFHTIAIGGKKWNLLK